jgi:outer membrane protein assembly factor BamD
MNLLLFILTFALSLAFGCSSAPKKTEATAHHTSGTDEQIFIGDTVEKNYDPNVILKRAEAFYDKDDYQEALIEYQHFLDLHRIHVLAPYAQFKIGMSYFRMFKTIDRDPAPVIKAQENFERLLKEFPGSKYQAEAIEKIRACNDLMAQTYYFVGQFYYRRESFLAAAYRFESIMEKFPDMEVAPDALYYLALAYNELGAKDWAREKLVMLAQQYPENKHTKESQQLLAKLNLAAPNETAVAQAGRIEGRTPAELTGNISASTPSPSAPSIADLPSTGGSALPSGSLGLTANGQASAVPVSMPPHTICRMGSWC